MQFKLCVIFLLATALPAQVGRGTLFHSLSAQQLTGVTAIQVTGGGRVTPGSIQGWSAAEGAGRARIALGFDGLGLWFEDRNGDGRPLDWPDVDALDVRIPTAVGATQPSIYDYDFSFANDVFDQNGLLATSGDVLRFSGIGGLSTVVTRAQLQASLGTTTALNVDAYAVIAGGAIMVSFSQSGTGNNIVSPLSGNPAVASFLPNDVFIIRPPYGALPAIIGYRGTELAPIVNAYYPNYTFNDLVAIDDQPAVPAIINPWDPTGLYQGGFRPRILFCVGQDDNVFNVTAALNPLTTAHNFYAIVGNGAASVAGYVTNISGSNRVFVDAISVPDYVVGSASRLTLEPSTSLPTAGSNMTMKVVSPAISGTRFQVVLTTTRTSSLGITINNVGFDRLLLNPLDPLLFTTFTAPVNSLFLTGPANADGTAVTPSFPTPTTPGLKFYFQAIQLSPPYPLTTPAFVELQ